MTLREQSIVCLVILALIGCSAEPSPAAGRTTEDTGTIVVQASKLRNSKGRVGILLFDSSEGFPSGAGTAIRVRRLAPKGESVTIRFKSVPYGEYAVSVLHDENDNRELDTNFFGLPKEGYGVSRNPKPGFGPPAYDEAVFTLDGPEKTLEIKVLYLDEMAEERGYRESPGQ